jgi:hypothetical protein
MPVAIAELLSLCPSTDSKIINCTQSKNYEFWNFRFRFQSGARGSRISSTDFRNATSEKDLIAKDEGAALRLPIWDSDQRPWPPPPECDAPLLREAPLGAWEAPAAPEVCGAEYGLTLWPDDDAGLDP